MLKPDEKADSDRVVEQRGSQVAAVLHFAYEIVKSPERNDDPPGFEGVWQNTVTTSIRWNAEGVAVFASTTALHVSNAGGAPQFRMRKRSAPIMVGTPERLIGRFAGRGGAQESLCCRRWPGPRSLQRLRRAGDPPLLMLEDRPEIAWYHAVGIAAHDLVLDLRAPAGMALARARPARSLGGDGAHLALYAAACWQVWVTVQVILGQLRP